MSNDLVLERFNYGPEGTFGKLMFPTGEFFWTVERPWLGNKKYESCIPDGNYFLESRHSPVVSRSSGGEFQEGWEVTDVPGRTFIMLHPGNWPGDLAGCIAPGKRYLVTQNRKGQYSNSVMDSRTAFREMMELMDQYNDWTLDVRPFFMVYP